jgi:hypothetical protein
MKAKQSAMICVHQICEFLSWKYSQEDEVKMLELSLDLYLTALFKFHR